MGRGLFCRHDCQSGALCFSGLANVFAGFNSADGSKRAKLVNVNHRSSVGAQNRAVDHSAGLWGIFGIMVFCDNVTFHRLGPFVGWKKQVNREHTSNVSAISQHLD